MSHCSQPHTSACRKCEFGSSQQPKVRAHRPTHHPSSSPTLTNPRSRRLVGLPSTLRERLTIASMMPSIFACVTPPPKQFQERQPTVVIRMYCNKAARQMLREGRFYRGGCDSGCILTRRCPPKAIIDGTRNAWEQHDHSYGEYEAF